jgi:hypothetical protein
MVMHQLRIAAKIVAILTDKDQRTIFWLTGQTLAQQQQRTQKRTLARQIIPIEQGERPQLHPPAVLKTHKILDTERFNRHLITSLSGYIFPWQECLCNHDLVIAITGQK